MMKVKTIMSSPVVTVELDDRLSIVNEIFSNTRFHHLLVVEKRKLFGVISDRDLFKALSPNLGKASEKATDLATLNKKVHQIMSRDPIFLYEEDNVIRVVELFDENNISCIPIVNSKQQPVGIVSWRDIIKVIRQKNSNT